MNSTNLTENVKQLELKLKRFEYSHLFDDSALQYAFRDCSIGVEYRPEYVATLVYAVCDIFTQELVDESREYPADWWSHFKVAYFPRWLIRRFPAKMTGFKFSAKAWYPNLALDADHGPVRFIQKCEPVSAWDYPNAKGAPKWPNEEF